MTFKIQKIAFFAVLLVSCSDRDGGKTKSPEESRAAALFGNLPEKSFFDNSSELRCEALKSFYKEFASEEMEGASVEEYSCVDASDFEEAYWTKVEFKSGNKTSVVSLELHDKRVGDIEYCPIPFVASFSELCSSSAFHFQDGETKSPGLLNPNLPKLKEYLQDYVNGPRTKDLAYGVDASEFAKSWISKFDGTLKHSLRSSDGALDLWLKLTPNEKDQKTGSARIVDANVEAFEQGKPFFFCRDKECLLSREYRYVFNGHRLAMIGSNGEVLTLYMPRPE